MSSSDKESEKLVPLTLADMEEICGGIVVRPMEPVLPPPAPAVGPGPTCTNYYW